MGTFTAKVTPRGAGGHRPESEKGARSIPEHTGFIKPEGSKTGPRITAEGKLVAAVAVASL